MSFIFGFDFKSRFTSLQTKYSVKFRLEGIQVTCYFQLDVEWVLIPSLDLPSMRQEFSEKQDGSENGKDNLHIFTV